MGEDPLKDGRVVDRGSELHPPCTGRLIDLDISEIGLCFPIRDEPRPMFEKIARDVLPKLKGRS